MYVKSKYKNSNKENISIDMNKFNKSYKCTDVNISSKSKDKLDLSFWDLPEIIIKKYEKIGITRMFEWQADCLMSGSALSKKKKKF